MSFRRSLLERAAARPRRVVLCEGDDPRVREAAALLRRDRIAEPVLLGGGGLDPAADPRRPHIAQ
jgi:phosphotransacetylase